MTASSASHCSSSQRRRHCPACAICSCERVSCLQCARGVTRLQLCMFFRHAQGRVLAFGILGSAGCRNPWQSCMVLHMCLHAESASFPPHRGVVVPCVCVYRYDSLMCSAVVSACPQLTSLALDWSQLPGDEMVRDASAHWMQSLPSLQGLQGVPWPSLCGAICAGQHAVCLLQPSSGFPHC